MRCGQVVHALLTEMEQEGKLPRRLVAALQSMFATAAGSRQETHKLVVQISTYLLLLAHTLGCNMLQGNRATLLSVLHRTRPANAGSLWS